MLRPVEGGFELERDNDSLVVARPGLDNGNVSILQPGSWADLATERLRFVGLGTTVTAVIVAHPMP